MEKKKRQYILMHRNTEVARTVRGGLGEWEVKEPKLLPTGVVFKSREVELVKAVSKFCKDYKITEAEFKELKRNNQELADDWAEVQLSVLVEMNGYNQNLITSWLAHRVLPLGRSNAKKLYQTLNLSQANTPQEKAKIALIVSALSIIDNYWLTYDNSNKTWEQVDIRKHSLSRGLAVVALTGSSITLNARELTDPLAASAEITTHGAYPKGIFREAGGLYMYKSGSIYTVAAEVAVSKILDSSNVFGHVEYVYAKQEGLDCSKCLLMTHSRRDIVPAMALGNDAVAYALSKYRKQIAQMCVVDFIVSNPDRHSMNWGFFRESPIWDITGLHWLYDHNNAFDPDEIKGNKEARSCLAQDPKGNQRIGLKDAAVRMYKYSDFKFIRPVSKSAFKLFGRQANAVIKDFVARCKFLGIDVKIK